VRVKITYGINMEEVPEEVSNLLDYAYNKHSMLDSQLELIDELVNNEDLDTAIVVINNARRSLIDLDSRLADIESIAHGYTNYQKEEGDRDVSERGPFVDSTGNSDDGSEPRQSTVRIHK